MVAAASAAARAEAQASEAARAGEASRRKAGEKGKAKAKPRPQLQLASDNERPAVARKALGLQRSTLLSSTRIQPALMISQPGDAAEAEADRVAAQVMAMPDPGPRPSAGGGGIQRSPLIVQRAPAGPADTVADPATEAAVKKELSGGAPMAPDVASFFGRRFNADFSGVRIHTDGKAENLSTRLGARAFTYGRHVFFNAGQYNPETEDGSKLIAHELTHTIQQQAAIQLKEAEAPRVNNRSTPQAQRGIVSRALDWIADKANYIPGFRLFTIVIGVNPINMSKVERSGANILRALIEFIPGGGAIVDALNNHGIFEKGGKFIEDQFRALGMVGSAFRDALMEFIDSLGWRDIFRLGSVWDRAKRIFTAPVDKLIAFGKGLVTGIAQLVKDAILKPLGRWAAGKIPKWNLLVAVFGKNPISDEKESPSSAIIGAFMELIGQQEVWENIQKGGAVSKAWAWFKGAMSGALSLVLSIPGRVISVIKSLTIFDIVTIAGAFGKIMGAFAGFVKDFGSWALKQVLSLLEIIFSVVAPSVLPYLKKARSTFSTIIKAPGRFIGNLVRAGKLGFNLFKVNFARHLRDALFRWLLGSAEGAGIYFPKSFAPLELLKMGLSVLGLTWANLRAKLVAATSETVVKTFETGFDLVVTLVKEGPAAAWQQLLETLSNLKNMVVDAAIDFVKGEVVRIAIEKLVSFLTPAGAFIQAILSIYRTITFIVNKLSEIARFVAGLIDGIAAIAAGAITPAAQRVETLMANGLALAISFLASFAGLGNIPKKVMEIIKKIRAPVDKAMDKVVTWVITQAKKLGKMAKEGAAKLFEWWKEKQPFTNQAGEKHTIRFIGSGPSAKLGIQSELMSIEAYLDAYPDKTSADWKTAKSVFDREKRVIFTPLPKGASEEKRIKDVKKALADISAAFARLSGEPPTASDYPATTKPTPGPKATIKYIVGTPKGGSKPGKGPNTGTPGWKEVYEAGLTQSPHRWVQMHIISEVLGGPGSPDNLIPAPGSINTGPFRSFEHSTLELAQAKSGSGKSAIKNVVWVKVDVTLSGVYATRIAGQAGLYFWRGKKDGWVKNEKYSFFSGTPIPLPPLKKEDQKVSLNYSSGTALGKITKDQKLIDIIKQFRIYPSVVVFENRVKIRAKEAGVVNYIDKVNRILAKIGSEVELHGSKGTT